MAVQVDLPMEAALGRHQHQRALNAVLLFPVTFLLGYLGWVLPSAGGSLAIPTLIVFGIGCAIALAWWISFRDWAVVMSAIAITIGASIWTFAFSLPASLTWGSNATVQAQTVLSRLDSSAKVDFTPLCSNIETGSVGPIEAPYRKCAGFTPRGHYFAVFTAAGQTTRGLGYTDWADGTFGNECARHLVGRWWMFTSLKTSNTPDCPVGYQFHGGG